MGKFIAVYMRYGIMGDYECDNLQEAISFLKMGNDECLHLPIAVIEAETKSVKWQANIFPETEKGQIEKFINKHLLN
jgi:hypothetical protein